MGTVIQRRIMEVYDANKHRDTPAFEKVGNELLLRLQAEQREREAKRKAELIERAKRRAQHESL